MAWQIDGTHSQVVFSIKHMAVSTVRGHFDVLRGQLNIDEANPANSSVDAEIDATSINTRDTNRDNHLRGADFFDVEKYPLITFKSTKVESAGGNNYTVTGDLTLHGVTKSIILNTEYSGQIKDPYGLDRVGLNTSIKLNRRDFGLEFGATLANGSLIVGNDIKVEIELEAVSKPEA